MIIKFGSTTTRLAAHSVMSATDMLGHWALRGLSAADSGLASALCPRMLACNHSWCW